MLCGCLHYTIFLLARFKMNLLRTDLTANRQDKLWSSEIKYVQIQCSDKPAESIWKRLWFHNDENSVQRTMVS